ncbi:MAG: VWA domain-containing protein [Solibacillus sp.]
MATMKKLFAVVMSLLLVFSVLPPIVTNAATIKDMPATGEKTKAANWAVDNKYMVLSGGVNFSPNALVMEKELVQMIAGMDANYSFSAASDMQYAYYADLNLPLFGTASAGKRNANVSRGQFARVYAAMNGLDLSEKQAVQYLYMQEITKGTTGKRTYEDYAPQRNITRGDLVVFMYRAAQKGSVAIDGLDAPASGKDDSEITLPTGFVSSESTVELTTTPGKNTNDKLDRPSVYQAIESIKVSKEDIIANGIDQALVTIKLRDSYGNDIPYDESLEFKVTSKSGATFRTTSNPNEKAVRYIASDGPELSMYVTAPRLTKSVKDTIELELINKDDVEEYYTYEDRMIEVALRYVPQAELRITYEVMDPEQVDFNGGGVEPAPTPTPALPEVSIPETTNTQGATPNTEIEITEMPDLDEKTFEGTKFEVYTDVNGKLKQGRVDLTTTFYDGAVLKFGGQEISNWLFEQILDRGINGNGSADLGLVRVLYSINSDGVPVYDILADNLSKEFLAEFADVTGGDSFLYKAIVYLIRLLPKADDVTLAHEGSITIIKTSYDKLGQLDKGNLQKAFSQEIGKLEGAQSKIKVLLKGQELAQRPDGLDRYTKVIVNVVLPGGQVLTNYKGQVEVAFNGNTKVAKFDTNTVNYNKATGSAGSAVVYFDDIVYGESKVTAKIIEKDLRFDKALQTLDGVTATETIFTNPRFPENSCAREAEIAFVVDHSASVRKHDKNNYVAEKTKALIRQLEQDKNIVYHYNTKSYFEMEGAAQTVGTTDGLLKYQFDGNGTRTAEALDVALNKLSNNQFAEKAIVLVTDGKASSSKVKQVIEKAQKKGVKIHTVAVGKYNDINEALLRELAEGTGGSYNNIETVHHLHGAYETIINAILCEDPPAANSCASGDMLFTESKVHITSKNIVLDARVNTNCPDVTAVSVIFTSSGGSVTYDLQHRGGTIYRLTRYVTEFKPFSLYSNVEFEAYDEDGQLIASKSVDI